MPLAAQLSNADYSSTINVYRVFRVKLGLHFELTSMTFEMLLKGKAVGFCTQFGLLYGSPKTNVVGV